MNDSSPRLNRQKPASKGPDRSLGIKLSVLSRRSRTSQKQLQAQHAVTKKEQTGLTRVCSFLQYISALN
ncbi:hypothetical protein P4U97_14240 [Bacillus swezeyi]|uniref:hypothetical protein n=1 Tax=Bacillus swezeyi TaxID=1925020 RepID=UPI002E239349|nr:hypothetical protein [Bacillus swezeyi]